MTEDKQMALDAYSKLVFKRFIDDIRMECWKILRDFPLEAEKALNCISDTSLDRCLIPNKDVERNREALKTKVSELQAGLEVLDSLW